MTYDGIDRESERRHTENYLEKDCPKIIPQFSTAKLHPLLRKGS
jgi:hypothetical protein